MLFFTETPTLPPQSLRISGNPKHLYRQAHRLAYQRKVGLYQERGTTYERFPTKYKRRDRVGLRTAFNAEELEEFQATPEEFQSPGDVSLGAGIDAPYTARLPTDTILC